MEDYQERKYNGKLSLIFEDSSRKVPDIYQGNTGKDPWKYKEFPVNTGKLLGKNREITVKNLTNIFKVLLTNDQNSMKVPGKYKKLDGVGPIDNRPSTDKLHRLVKKNVTHDMWHMTPDMGVYRTAVATPGLLIT